MEEAMESINVLSVRSEQVHCGPHSGYKKFLYAFEDSVRLVDDFVVYNDLDFLPWHMKLVHKVARRFIRTPKVWYGYADWMTERKTVRYLQQNKVDVIHYLFTIHSFYGLPQRLVRRGIDSPALVGSYHLPPDRLEELAVPEVFKQLDRVVVLTEDQVEYFAQHMPRDRIDLIPHGVATDFFTPPETRVFDERLRVLTVGNFMRDYEAYIATAEAFRGDGNVDFVILNRDLDARSLPDNVTLHRYVSDEELRDLYQKSDLLFLPLTKATANNALVEAMSCGLPVLASDLPGIEFNAPGDECLKFVANEVSDIKQKMQELRTDVARRRRMSDLAIARAGEYAWGEIARQTEACYRRAIADRAARER
jgi:glycosyltransferase involved in cell wall biosynthesis